MLSAEEELVLARQIRERYQRYQARQARATLAANTAMTVTYKSLSKWSIKGLDMSDAGFAKLHDKESKFEDDRKQYDSAADKFKRFVDNLKEKVNRIHAKKTFSIRISSTLTYKVLRHYSTITKAQMKASQQKPNLRFFAVTLQKF